SVPYDTVAPAVTVNQKAGQADATNAAPMLWTVTFSEPVTGFDASDLARGGSSTGGTVAVTGSGASYEISLSAPSNNGTATFSVNAAKAQDLAGNSNTASTSTDNTVTYDTVAPSTTITTSPASPNGTNGWFKQSGVSFTLVASDATSGVASSSYTIDGGAPQTYSGSVSISTQGDHTVTYRSTDNAGNAESFNTTHIKIDNVLPAATIATSPTSPDGANGWFKQSSVSFTLAATDATSGVAGSTYTIDGGAPLTYSGSVAISTLGDHTVTYWATDNAGNVETANSTHIKLDNVGPTSAFALTTKTGGGSFLSGNTLFYQGSALGSFTIQNTVTDSISGAASSTFAALGGTTTGWTHTTPDVQTTPTGGPFVSNAFSWAAGTASAPTEIVTGTDAAGNGTGAPPLTLTNDSTAPSGGSIIYTNGFFAALSVPIAFSDGFDAGSGIDPTGRSFERDQVAPTATGACGTFPGTFPTTVALSSGNDTSVATNTCYQYRYRVLDRVGNSLPYTTTSVAKVDTTAPTASIIAAVGQGPSKIDSGDKLTLTYADAFGVTASSIVSGWDGTASKPVNVTFTDGGGANNDSIVIPGLGTINLGSPNWLSSTSTASETLTMPALNQFVMTIAGNPSGTNNNTPSTFVWSTATGTAKDGAGNSATGSATSTGGQSF
ncbi:MAG TPA: Ig-like domain-containing protein, partial [Solirubrobacteraceae bacterium]|nr:Ig-like domain-containing protein [Solirubrobacteraceae bacterium]